MTLHAECLPVFWMGEEGIKMRELTIQFKDSY